MNRSELTSQTRHVFLPRRFLDRPGRATEILERFSIPRQTSELSYATVRDYCESIDRLPYITGLDGDLKNVQRPWAVKALLQAVPPPARLLEIGGGEPIVSGFLNELGYDVTLVDPYDGFGNGPMEYGKYVESFPNVKIVRNYFGPDLDAFPPASFNAIFSISVLEHIPVENQANLFQAIERFLSPDGASIHCFDFILQGVGQEHALTVAESILNHQARLESRVAENGLPDLLMQLTNDIETFFLSPQGHHHWRGKLSYSEFPFRRVVSLQTIAFSDQRKSRSDDFRTAAACAP